MIMGMPISVDIPKATTTDVFQEVFAFFRQVDARFSPYIDSSEVSLFSNSNGKQSKISSDLADIIEQCAHYEHLTDGYFSAYYSGSFDPSGYVKAWAINIVSSIITRNGYDTFLINIAGDMIARGNTKVWNVGIQDPLDIQAMLGTVQLTNQAIATSGTYERGSHIYNPHTKVNTTDLLSVTVYGDDIIKADVFATTLMAMSYEKAYSFMQKQPDYAALIVKQNGEAQLLNGFKLES